jgi:predicted outer membrane repeat protein
VADPNKTDAGSCGCGAPETDTDSDGTPDCDDSCDLDPDKTAPGACGCGVSDVDTDGDGDRDCDDEDDDNDTVLDADDADPLDPQVCGDVDADGCDDCDQLLVSDPANDGPDQDQDGICILADNCPIHANSDQTDTDGDGAGDECETPTNVLTVLPAATGNGDGSDWLNAATDLQTALAAARNSGGSITEIWVAQGVHTPGEETDDAFDLIDDVGLYGGFSGIELQRDERDPAGNETILSGDFERNDDTAIEDPKIDNSLHVVNSLNNTATAILDGFTITRGSATGGDAASDRTGGGILITGGAPTINGCVFQDNEAIEAGGAIGIGSTASPTISDCEFEANSAGERGGAIANTESSPTLDRCRFFGNTAPSGGALSNLTQSDPSISNCIFVLNTAELKGGAVHNDDESDPALLNCSFANNQAEDVTGGGLPTGEGGAMWNGGSSSPTSTNCIFWGDIASVATQEEMGTEIFNESPAETPTFTHCDIDGSNGSGADWDDELGVDGGNNIDTDPRFQSSPGPAADDFGDLRLDNISLCIGAGNNAAWNAVVDPIDLAGNPRIVNTVDMGAYEVQP